MPIIKKGGTNVKVENKARIEKINRKKKKIL